MYTADCQGLLNITNIYFIIFVIITLSIKKKIAQNFKNGYTSFHVRRPSIPFIIGIPSALNRRLIYNLYATFLGDKAIENHPTLIRGKGNVSTY